MAKVRGYEIKLTTEGYVFADTWEFVSETYKSRPCGYCGKADTLEGYDGCIGHIPGALNACCGHGNTDEAYVQFPDRRLGGQEALDFIKHIKDS